MDKQKTTNGWTKRPLGANPEGAADISGMKFDYTKEEALWRILGAILTACERSGSMDHTRRIDRYARALYETQRGFTTPEDWGA